MKHYLFEAKTEKVINLTLNDKKLISETGKTGKTKTTEKEFSTSEEALKGFIKKEWESLKKGFVLQNENPQLGEPYLHYFVGGGYTGALSFQATPNGIFVYKNNGEKDCLILLDSLGNVKKEIELPEMLAWNIEYRAETDSLLLDLDHFIFEYRIQENSFRSLLNEKSNWTSFVSVATGKTAFAQNGKIYVVDNQNKKLFSQDYKIQTINGHTPFCGKLSGDGNQLAFHNKKGEVQIINTSSGNAQNITGDFHSIEQMAFVDDLLAIREMYGSWGMRYFDLQRNEEVEMKSIEVPEYTKDVNAFCFNADGSKLALVKRDWAYIFDFREKKLCHSFRIDHVVKRCNIKFVGEDLGVRTDYGCFSLYKV